MTLALYGKTRKRQGGLLLAAFLAVVVAVLGAVATRGTPANAVVTLPDTEYVQFTQGEGANNQYRYVLTATAHTQNAPVAGQTTYTYTLGLENLQGSVWVPITGSTAEGLLSHWVGALGQVCGGNSLVVSFSGPGGSSTYGTDGSTGLIGFKFDNDSLFGTYTLVMNGVFGLVENGFVANFKQGNDTFGPASVAGPDCLAPAPTGAVIIGKVKDPTAGVPAADGTSFGGTIVNDGSQASTPWSGITFGQFTAPISLPAGVAHTVDETSPTNGWTEVAWVQGSGTPAAPVCPADKASYVPGSNIGVNVNAGQTIVLCVMNTTPVGTLRSVGATKTHSPAGPYLPGSTFEWILTANVSATTTGINQLSDTIQLPLVAEAHTSYTISGAGLTCNDADNNVQTVSCSLASGSSAGTYSVSITITIPQGAACTSYPNTAVAVGPDVNGVAIPGTPLFTTSVNDSVDVTGCGDATVTKTHMDFNESAGDGNYNLGETFWFVLTFEVTGGPLATAMSWNDVMPAGLDATTVIPHSDPTNQVNCGVHTPAPPEAVSCSLQAGTPVGIYSHKIGVSVLETAACGPALNTVRTGGVYGEGDPAATDTVNITGCGNVTFVKKNPFLNPSVGDVHMEWTIEVTNSSGLPGSITIWDPNTSLVNETCSNAVTESPADTYYCEVPASTTVGMLLRNAAIPNYNVQCDDIRTSNTAAISGNTQSSQTVQFVDLADGSGEDCITVTKDKSQTSQPPTWNITITNNSDSAQDVWIVDDGATFSGVVIGNDPCAPPIGTSMTNGMKCTVPANGQIVISVTKPAPSATCEGTDVDNAVSVWVGTYSSTPTALPDFTDNTGNQFDDLGSDPGDCDVTVNLCKLWRIAGLAETLTNGTGVPFSFDVNGNAEDYIITGADENEPTSTCIHFSVHPDDFPLTITENVPTGFKTPSVQLNSETEIPGNSITIDYDGETCEEGPILQSFLQGLASSIQAVLGEQVEGSDLNAVCTVTFYNDDEEDRLPSGNLQIEKYLDINGDGDANDAGEGPIPGWEMTTTCDESIVGSDVQDTNGSGVVFIAGLTSGDDCTVTEEVQPTYSVTRVTVNGANFGASTSANVTVPEGGTTIVRFYNRQLGGIAVHKNTVNVLNGIETPNLNDDDGWTITVKSAACGIDLVLDTDANGNAVFSGLPMCTDYVVAEVLASGEPGYTPVGPASVSGQTPTVGGNTQVNFTNETRSTTPPCPNCTPGTQTVPTPTPTPVTPVPPTATPCVGCGVSTVTAPTGTPPPATPTTGGGTNPTAVSTVAGDRTPGPGQTPIAPSTGEGGFGGGAGGNLLLILVGLGALAVGSAFMAVGRKGRS